MVTVPSCGDLQPLALKLPTTGTSKVFKFATGIFTTPEHRHRHLQGSQASWSTEQAHTEAVSSSLLHHLVLAAHPQGPVHRLIFQQHPQLHLQPANVSQLPQFPCSAQPHLSTRPWTCPTSSPCNRPTPATPRLGDGLTALPDGDGALLPLALKLPAAGISKVFKFAAVIFETPEHRHRHLQGS